MLDIVTLLAQANDQIARVVSNPLAFRGPNPREPFLGLQLMPERIVPENQFTETQINYRTLVANDATDYSPVQLKGNMYVGSFDVKLRSSDIGSDFTAADYEAVISILKRFTNTDNVPLEAMIRLLKWVDKGLLQPQVVKNEKMVWECVVDAVVKRTGDDDFLQDVNIPNPDGHRVAALGDWSDPTYDPFDDIEARSDFSISKSQKVRLQICGKPVLNKLLNNPIVQKKVGGYINVTNQGALVGNSSRPTLRALNAFLEENEQAPIAVYNKQYFDNDGPHYFLKRDVFVQICETDQSEEIPQRDGDPLVVENTLGYVGIGRNAGHPEPGRTVTTEEQKKKPIGIHGEGYQKSFPVNQNPEAVNVITGIE